MSMTLLAFLASTEVCELPEKTMVLIGGYKVVLEASRTRNPPRR